MPTPEPPDLPTPAWIAAREDLLERWITVVVTIPLVPFAPGASDLVNHHLAELIAAASSLVEFAELELCFDTMVTAAGEVFGFTVTRIVEQPPQVCMN